MNKFKILGGFVLPRGTTKNIVVFGEIVTGFAKIGMKTLLPADVHGQKSVEIIGVEFVDKVINGETKGYISLILDYYSEEYEQQLLGKEIILI
jgi:hypothetical protein